MIKGITVEFIVRFPDNIIDNEDICTHIDRDQGIINFIYKDEIIKWINIKDFCTLKVEDIEDISKHKRSREII